MRKRWLLVGMVFLLVPWLLVGCGIPQEQYDAIVSDLGKAQQELQSTKTEVEATQAELKATQAQLADSEATVSTLETDLETANSRISGLQADVSTQRTLNSALSEELKTVKDPRHFQSLTELVDWLDQDDTDTAYTGKSLTELAFILQVRALRDGYLLPASFEDLDEDYYVEYIGNLTYIGDEIYYVGPSDDDVFLWAYVSPIPSHPLPLD